MGSGSSSWTRWPDSEKTDIEDKQKRTEYQQSVNQLLTQLLSRFNDRDVEQINTHLDTIQQALEKEIEGAVELFFGGSVSKHTYVDGLSDVDMLVAINNTSLADASPEQVKKYFAQRLRDRLPNSEVAVGRLAVTVYFKSSGQEIQLLPAVKTMTGIRIADSTGEGWSNVVHPDRFATQLTKVNQACSNRVVPVVKLIKGLNSQLPGKVQLKGYHIESLAIEVFKKYSGNLSYKEMVQYFCKTASVAVLSPINDSTGQSVHVDDYLGTARSKARQMCSGAWERLGNKLARADIMLSVDEWKGMFGE